MAIQAINMRQVANDVAMVWGFSDFLAVPAFGRERIRIDINAAIQQMHDSGEDFFGSEDVEITLIAGQGRYVLDQDIQSVLDPVVLQDGTLLRKLTTETQVFQYGTLFHESLTHAVVDGKPEAFFIDAIKSDDDEDNVQTILQLLPAPSSANIANKAVLSVIREGTMFSTAQLTAGTASLPIPHKYVESIFLPLARYNATTCFLFYKKESEPKYLIDYERALQLLGHADPRQYPKPPDSNTNAMQVRAPSQ